MVVDLMEGNTTNLTIFDDTTVTIKGKYTLVYTFNQNSKYIAIFKSQL